MRQNVEQERAPGIGIDEIVRTEVGVINRRRHTLGREPLAFHGSEPGSSTLDAVGLALSGGGIRSAAFSLGVLQALNRHDVLRNVDYLSTVSGGGYIGASLSVTMTRTEGKFVFGDKPNPTDSKSVVENTESEAVGHLRNYSNYLLPAGGRYLGNWVAIFAREILPNLGLILSFVLLLAALTIVGNPNRSDLPVPFTGRNYSITLLLVFIGVMFFYSWAIFRSSRVGGKQPEFGTRLAFLGGAFFFLLALVFFIEFQPFMIGGMFDLHDGVRASRGGDHALLTASVLWLATIAVPVGLLVMIFSQQFDETITAASTTSKPAARALAIIARGLVWVAGVALPLVIWVVYLYLCYWGIINDGPAFGQPELGGARGFGDHTPTWLIAAAALARDSFGRGDWLPDPFVTRPVALLYCYVAVILTLLSWFMKANTNSLHGPYRDRLSKAFLFDPNEPVRPAGWNGNSASLDRDFPPLGAMRLSELVSPNAYAPYHLINTSLNIHGSPYANRRARNADFFLLSPLYIGSHVTGYAPTIDIERISPDLDIATAMAISGAAMSANMQADSLRCLTPTLALLNISLGYWLKNPRYAGPGASLRRTKPQRVNQDLSQSLWSQMTGRLQESSDQIYLTDGGHLENLGVYELLRRRCRLIVVVDAEADPGMYFNSFIKLQRYARIDFGIGIEMPWQTIQGSTLRWMGYDSAAKEPPRQASAGPHAAIGIISYSVHEIGFVLYLKSSLTGDENDYVRDYARRHYLFPHERTGNQFFNEEQFEVYRALGFHITYRLLAGHDTVAVAGAVPEQFLTFKDVSNPSIEAVRAALTPRPTTA